MDDKITRRKFIRESAVAGAAIGGRILPSNIVRVKNNIEILS